MKQKWLITLGIVAVVAAAFFVPLGAGATAVHDAALERSVGAFAIAKGLNAVISLIQGTELNATPAGVGVTITIGEVLDPMNDLVERFSWIMLASSVSLGIQKLLLSVGELLWVKITLGAIGALLLASLWYLPLQRRMPLVMLLRLAVVMIVLRFGAAGFIYAENLLYTQMMQPQYNTSVAILTDTREELDAIAAQSKREAAAKKEEGFLDSLSGSYDRMKRFFDIDARLEALQSTLEAAQKEVLNLITLFVTLNLLLPLIFLWAVVGLFKWAATGRFDADAIREWFYRYRRY